MPYNHYIIPAVFLLGALLLIPILGWMLAFLVLIAALVGIWFLNKPKMLLAAAICWYFFLAGQQMFINRTPLRFMDDLLTVALLAITLAYYAIKKPVLPRPAAVVSLLILAGMVWGLFVAWLNGVPKTAIVRYALAYYKGFILFFFVIIVCPGISRRFAWRFFLFVCFVQILFNLGWALHINPLPNIRRYHPYDFAVGSLGLSHFVGYYMIAGMFFLFYRALTEKRMRAVWGYLLLVGVFMAQFVFTYTVHAYPLIPLGFLTLAFVYGFRKFFEARATLIVLCVAVPAVILFLMLPKPDFERQERLTQKIIHGPKVQALRDTVTRVLYRDAKIPFIGAGVGNAASFTALIFRRPFAVRYYGAQYYSLMGAFDVGGSVMRSPTSSLATVLSERGYPGLLLWMILYAYIARAIYRNIRSGYYQTGYEEALAMVYLPILVTWVALSVIGDYYNVFCLVNPFWLLTALVLTSEDRKQKKSASETEPINSRKPRRGVSLLASTA